MTLDGLVLRVGEGGKLSFRGTELTFKARGERPAGGPTVFEFREAPGFSTGDHIHSKIEEIFYVIEGEFEIRVGDRMLKARPGDFMLVPPNVPHGYGNPGNVAATMLVAISPGGVHERYFEELAEIMAKPGPPDASAIADLRARYDTEQVSPLTI